MRISRNFCLLSVFVCCLLSEAWADIPHQINLQGVLVDTSGASMKNDTVSVLFTIYDAAIGGTAKWTETDTVTTDAAGVFTMALGANSPIPDSVFSDTLRWLGIQVEAEPELIPRTQLVSGPYSYVSGSGPSGGSSGWTDDGTVVRLTTGTDSVGIGTTSPGEPLEVAGNVLITGKATIGSKHTNTGVAAFVAGDSSTASGFYSTVGGGLGNESSSDQTVVAGGAFNTASGVSTVVSGGYQNAATAADATVAGGFADTASGFRSTVSGGNLNSATDEGATVGGGATNIASGGNSTVSGGFGNVSSGRDAAIGGGAIDTASGDAATIAGGTFNLATGVRASISGGSFNTSSDTATTVGGGAYNVARGVYSVVAGGGGRIPADSNAALGDFSFVGGGHINLAEGPGAVVAGGSANSATGTESSVVGGNTNRAAGLRSFVGGGFENKGTGDWSTVSGGFRDSATAWLTTVAGGGGNWAGGQGATVGGGQENSASAAWSTVGGGGGFPTGNNALAQWATVSGGAENTASGLYSVVPGGRLNKATGDYSLAAGRRTSALHAGSFVWGDSTDADFVSTAPNQFLVRADFTGIGRNSPVNTSEALGVHALPGTGTNFGGMYVSTPSGSAKPFYGYSAGAAAASAYHYYDGNVRKWILNVFGDHLAVTSAGDVGMGTVSPNYKLDVRGTIGSNVTLYHSDRRWKKDIHALSSGLDKVSRLRGVTFSWKRDQFVEMNFPEGKRIGLIAQEVEEVLPELVNEDSDGFKSVEYANLVAVLIEAVKELKDKSDSQAKELGKLRSQVEAMSVKPRSVNKPADPADPTEPTKPDRITGSELVTTGAR